jgi:hypothetical protein
MLADRVAVRVASASGARMRRTHIPVIILPLRIVGFMLLVSAQAGETSGRTAFGLSRRPAVLRGRE